MHSVQKILLKRLLLKSPQRYAELTREYDYENNVVFHLKQLIEKGLVKKEEAQYRITLDGIREITSYDIGSLEDAGHKTFFVGFVCEFEGKFLIKKHMTESSIFYNLPSGKPLFGEDMATALPRLFWEEVDVRLSADHFTYQSLHLKTVKTHTGDVIFDDAFAIYSVKVSAPHVQKMKFKKGCQWMSLDEISKLENCWPEIQICFFDKSTVPMLEYEFISDYVLG